MRFAPAPLLLSTPPFAPDPALSVGFGGGGVSPTGGGEPGYIAGYGQNRAATKLHDPITARAVVLSDGSKKIALVAVDVVGLFLPTVERVREKLPGFSYVMVSSTHNHEGPDTLGLWGSSPFKSGVDPDYLTRVVDGAAEAVKKADAALTPAVAKLGTAKGPELLHDGRLPIVLHDDLVAVRFEGRDGRPVGVLVE